MMVDQCWNYCSIRFKIRQTYFGIVSCKGISARIQMTHTHWASTQCHDRKNSAVSQTLNRILSHRFLRILSLLQLWFWYSTQRDSCERHGESFGYWGSLIKWLQNRKYCWLEHTWTIGLRVSVRVTSGNIAQDGSHITSRLSSRILEIDVLSTSRQETVRKLQSFVVKWAVSWVRHPQWSFRDRFSCLSRTLWHSVVWRPWQSCRWKMCFVSLLSVPFRQPISINSSSFCCRQES